MVHYHLDKISLYFFLFSNQQSYYAHLFCFIFTFIRTIFFFRSSY